MSIYGRFGQPVTIKRMGTLADVRTMEGRVDQHDRQAVALGSYVVVDDAGKERLYHQAFLKADGGSLEIATAIQALAASKDDSR